MAKGPKGSKAPKTKKSNRFIYLAVFIKKNKRVTKFKIRKGRYLYTFRAEKPDMAKRLSDSLDTNNIEKIEIKKKRVVKKAKK